MSATPHESFAIKARREHPVIEDRRQFPRMRREWAGRRVAVHFIGSRGTPNRRTVMGWAFGTLSADQGEHIVITEPRSGEAKRIHYRRVVAVYDLTTRKDQS